ncbi:hypothetical protein [Brevibacillus massiliensis]|uniref:hypothetical protein n=1 Tax=Brevibacillus massiliensis TaxID=1118054 RepID=UPI001FDFDC86|nr:hypothetical protein [Brevibacillus massiliensis]
MLVIIAAVSFCGGMLVSGKYETGTAFADKGDVEWARSVGYIKDSIDPKAEIPQAEFMKMVMEEYGEKQGGLRVPTGAENHWASEYYALAQAKGVIDCSCQIKPDFPLTLKEAAKFVMLGINRKGNEQVVSWEEVESWAKPAGDAEQNITYEQAASLIRKMDDIYTEKEWKVEGI